MVFHRKYFVEVRLNTCTTYSSQYKLVFLQEMDKLRDSAAELSRKLASQSMGSSGFGGAPSGPYGSYGARTMPNIRRDTRGYSMEPDGPPYRGAFG